MPSVIFAAGRLGSSQNNIKLDPFPSLLAFTSAGLFRMTSSHFRAGMRSPRRSRISDHRTTALTDGAAYVSDTSDFTGPCIHRPEREYSQ